MAQGSADSETYLLAIRCVSLAISSKTVFNNIGLLTNLYVRATKSPAVKNERRWIKLSQSEPFDIAGRPTTLATFLSLHFSFEKITLLFYL